MRRIIERVVTIVTTTTWKISWEPDSPPGEPLENLVSPEIPRPEISQTTLSRPTVTATEEVDLPEENAPDPL